MLSKKFFEHFEKFSVLILGILVFCTYVYGSATGFAEGVRSVSQKTVDSESTRNDNLGIEDIDMALNEQRLQHKEEQNREEWLKKHPPVKHMFDTSKQYDTSYVIGYLYDNDIAGHCGLAYRKDVVCIVEDGLIRFPINE